MDMLLIFGCLTLPPLTSVALYNLFFLVMNGSVEKHRFNLRSWVIVIMHDGVCQLLQMIITDNFTISDLFVGRSRN
jgi:hypothetical protein